MNDISLRDYQQRAFDRLARLITFPCPVKAYCNVLPTGAGKSVIIGALVSWYVSLHGGNVLVCSWSNKIVEQDEDKIKAFGADMTDIKCMTVQKMFHEDSPKTYDLIIVDECHKMYKGTAGYREIAKRMHNSNGDIRNAASSSIIIGLTATPYRNIHETVIDDEMFVPVDDCVTYKELIAGGYLVPPEYIKCSLFEMNRETLKVTNGDYDAGSMETQCRKARDAIAKTIEDASNRGRQKVKNACTLVFLPSKRMCEEIKKKLDAHNVASEIVLGETSEDERTDIYTKANVILNCGVMTTGIDIPRVTTIVMCRATKSVTLWKQIVGRGLRLHIGKSKCFIIDCGCNVESFGDDLDVFPSTIKEKRNGLPILSECKSCHRYISTMCKTCKFCNAVIRTDEEIHQRKLLNIYYEGGMVPVKEYKVETKFIPTLQAKRTVMTVKPYVGKQQIFTFSDHPYSKEKLTEYKDLMKLSEDKSQILFVKIEKERGFPVIKSAKLVKLPQTTLN